MAREKELFRDNLALLKESFGGKEIIPIKEVADYMQVCDRTLKSDKHFPIKKVGGKYFVPIVGLASWMS